MAKLSPERSSRGATVGRESSKANDKILGDEANSVLEQYIAELSVVLLEVARLQLELQVVHVAEYIFDSNSIQSKRVYTKNRSMLTFK